MTLLSRPHAVQFNLESVRDDFPILKRRISSSKPLVYLDNAATSQKPKAVLDAVTQYYECHNANVHRGVHILSEEATDLYEGARQKVQNFLNAPSSKEVIFVRGTTEAMNLLAQSYARPLLQAGDEVLISHMEHHSNIVPWQMVCEQTGASLKVIPLDEYGALNQEAFTGLLSKRTKIFACIHVSNALGTVNPIKDMIQQAKSVGAVTIIDGAQAAPHYPIDVQDLGCDFYAISGHKMFAPTGIGALFGRHELLDAMAPYQGGGEMIKYVSFDRTLYNDLPHKFEAGTPNISGAIGLGAAIDYMAQLDWVAVTEHEQDLLEYGQQQLSELNSLRIIGQAPKKASVISFWMEDAHPHDVGTILSHAGICVRTGHHCAQPVMQHFDVPATVRASFAFYNTRDEVDALVEGLRHVRKVLVG